jgi:DNA (cytosine-5)-methyltransferase 1
MPTHGPVALKPFQTVRDAIWKLRRHPGQGSQYTSEVERYFKLVPEGKNWRSLSPKLQREALGGSFDAGGGKTGFYRRLAWNRPAPTITGRANRKGSALCHPSATRPLSVRECAAIQGFPADWKLSGSMNQQYMQIGNAVPVALGRAIAQTILDHKALKSEPWLDNYDLLLEKAVTRLRASARNKRSVVPALAP